MAEMWKAATERPSENYEEYHKPTDPKTFEEYMMRTRSNAALISAFSAPEHIIDNIDLGPTIFHMRWTKISFQSCTHSLLTSDRPLHRPEGLASKDAYIALPMGPKSLFIAAHDGRAANALSEAKADRVIKEMHEIVVKQAPPVRMGC